MNSALSFNLKDHTRRIYQLRESDIFADELILTAQPGSEARSQLPLWQQLSDSKKNIVVYFNSKGNEQCGYTTRDTEEAIIQLRDMNSFAKLIDGRRFLLDISGLPHEIWAPIIRFARHYKVPYRVLYAEPAAYKTNQAPSSENVFDLSVDIQGLNPLPGFAKLLNESTHENQVLVTLLGFEGDRPRRIALGFDPAPKVVPVVGVPGFQIEYPSYTLACNRSFIRDHHLHSEMRFARASCPFSLYNVLEEIRDDNPGHYIYIAMVGTKPHAVGAVTFALDNELISELLFDHPVRKSGKTKGLGQIHIYDFIS